MPRKKSVNHGKIVEAAKKEFERCGFKEASMRNIAAEAGMSASGLYKHFPSKEEMFASLVEPVKAEFEREYRERERREYAELGSGKPEISAEQTGGNRWAMEYIYDHLEEFRLLVIKSGGTMYENYIHDVAKLEETSTLAFISELRLLFQQIAPIASPQRTPIALRTELRRLPSAERSASKRRIISERRRQYARSFGSFLS